MMMNEDSSNQKDFNWPWFIIGCVFLIAAIAAFFWAFSFEHLSPSRRFLLMWLLPLASGFGCGCFAGSFRFSGPYGSLAVAATGGFAVWLFSYFLLPDIPQHSSSRSVDAAIAIEGNRHYESFSNEMVRIGNPTFDIKVVNNAVDTLVLSKLRVSVRRSAVDPEALVDVIHDRFQHWPNSTLFANFGWGPVQDVRVSITHPEKSTFEFEEFEGSEKMDVSEMINRFSGDTYGRVEVKGEVAYRTQLIDGGGIRRKDFTVSVAKKHSGQATAGLPPSFVYDVKLQSAGENYEVECPISQVLEAKAADRIRIRIHAEKSSFHEITVGLYDISGALIAESDHVFRLFRPSRGASFFDLLYTWNDYFKDGDIYVTLEDNIL
jgi:hypothetical protein